MKQNYRASMIQLHTYAGLFMGWLLFAIFLTGTLSYFSNEISHWMRGVVTQPETVTQQVNRAYKHLQNQGAQSHSWRVNLADQRGSALTVQWRDADGRHSQNLPAQAGESPESKATRGGDFFVTFHYTLQLRQYGGRYLAGLAAMTMLIALYSGIFTHRRLLKDFFTLRTRSFMHFIKDGHAVSGIVTIPFVIVICLSALVIYISLFAPWFADQHFDNGCRELNREVSERLPEISAKKVASVPLPSLQPILEHTKQSWPASITLKSIRLDQPYQSTGRIIVEGIDSLTLTNNTQKLIYSSESGDIVGRPSEEGVSRTVRRVLYGLHEGHFFELDLRWLSFIQGTIATFLIATGMLIWVKKRDEKQSHNRTALAIVNKINLAVFFGLPLACLAYFSANQVLPASTANREELELAAFNYTLLLSALTIALFKSSISKLSLAVFGAALSALIVMSGLQTLIEALQSQDSIYMSMSFSMWIVLFIYLSLCWYLAKNYRREA